MNALAEALGGAQMDTELLNLIERMSVPEQHVNSDISISFKAHREAEKLNGIGLLPQLKEYILTHQSPKEKEKRNHAYFILGKLLQKIDQPEYTQFLINQLEVETDKYILSSMLDRLHDINKPDSLDIEPIIHCTKSEKWLIRHSAIRALSLSESPKARITALSFLESNDLKKDKYEICYAISALSTIGTSEDIPVLERLTGVRYQDIKIASQNVITKIKKKFSN